MADAMLQQQSVQKDASTDATTVSRQQEGSSKGAGTVRASESGKPRGKQPANPSKTPHVKLTTATNSDAFNAEALSILRQMNANINKTNKTVEELTGRVDALYNDFDGGDYDLSQGNGNDDYDVQDWEQDDQYAPDDQRSLSGDDDDVFSRSAKKFQKSDSVAPEVSEKLATVVNSTFREGMSDEHFCDVSKNILRPSNCEALKETRVNSGVWSVLKPTTQTDDSKMRGIQNSIVKAACNIVKIMDKGSQMFDDEMLVWGTDAIGLLGHANRWINIRRRDLHKRDMDPKLHHLCSPMVPFTDQLYGDSMIKDIKDIQELNKISRNVVRGGSSGRFRGRQFRGRRFQPYSRRAPSGRMRSGTGRSRQGMRDQKKSTTFQAA
ncbi:uncharacterized protein LOC123530066 [Mercenaria mercenaria]|uniref:uncharacterized protein LOC123530066 n=1 Tax=Mercenaria mercenaria TaxID=6596 RepID=UPI00234ECA56|nr:uncharacterized protein LOC123530066 [Mercenaria mercenaria]